MAVIQDLESILRKIRALVARADHANTPAPEAELSRKQAEKLMAKYAITAATLGDVNGGKTKPEDFKFDITGGYQNDRAMLANGIAKIFNCSLIRTRMAGGGYDFYVAGFQTDLDMFWTLFESLDRQLLMEINNLNGPVGFKKSFALGFMNKVHARLEEFYAQEVAEAEAAAPGTELVLASREVEVKAHVMEKMGPTTKGKSVKRDYSGIGAGRAAGARADIGLDSNKLKNQSAIAV